MADFSRESMLDMFIFEMNQLLDQLEQLIIECEEGYSMDNINEIFRIMHTVKGSAAMMLYENVSKTAHSIEDLFFYLREEDPSDVDYSSLTDLVLEGMDFIKNELAKIAEGGEAATDPTDIIKRIKAFLCVLKGEDEDKVKDIQIKTQNKDELKVNLKQHSSNNFKNKFECHLYFNEDCEMENIRSFNVINNLRNFGEILKTIPNDVIDIKSEEIIKKDGFKFIIATDISYEEIHQNINSTIYLKNFELNVYSPKGYRAIINFDEGCEMENVRSYTIIHNLKNIAENIKYFPEDIISEDSIEVIREKGFKIEFYINKEYDDVYEMLMQTLFLKSLTLEELVESINDEKFVSKKEEAHKIENKKDTDTSNKKNKSKENSNKKQVSSQQMISVNIGKLDQLLNLMGELVISEAMTTQNPDLDGLELENFNKSARQLRKIIKDVQDSVMSMRMVTLDATFFKMQRIVRDMCKALGKNIELVIEGRDTEVDKNIIEHISDPLMHIIRNSVDHGIETPEERVEKGKSEKGVIRLEARNSGGEIIISVKDDGAGINKDKVIAKAKSAGILKKPEEEYTDREIYQLIFHAGLSTKESVTSYSGRGVGMDVVTANIEVVGGSIIVESEPGQGTTTLLKIPLTLAIIEGMLISMGGAKYTLPISSIQETFKAKRENIFTDPDGNEMITLRGDVYNVVRLYDFFNAPTQVKDLEEGVMIMIENEGRTICIFVDELIGEQQVVVKSIPKYIKRIKGISGCTLLGNGDISLIIDVAGFFDN